MFFDKSKPTIEYTLTKSNRKTISIIIEKSGEVRVLAPKRLNNKTIQSFVLEKEPWIHEKRYSLNLNRIVKPSIYDGAVLELLGQNYKVIFKPVTTKRSEGVNIVEENLVFSYADEDKGRQAYVFESGLKQIILKLIHERVNVYSELMGVKPDKISVKDQKKRWGTCTSKGHVLFNWRLIFAPLSIIDYVVIHEMAHLKHMDHSAKFWEFVFEFDPNFKVKRNWLKRHGGFIDWSFKGVDIS